MRRILISRLENIRKVFQELSFRSQSRNLLTGNTRNDFCNKIEKACKNRRESGYIGKYARAKNLSFWTILCQQMYQENEAILWSVVFHHCLISCNRSIKSRDINIFADPQLRWINTI